MNRVSRKTFQKEGKWIVNPHRTQVVICVCGSKYIKTRENQISCIKCLVKLREAK